MRIQIVKDSSLTALLALIILGLSSFTVFNNALALADEPNEEEGLL